MALPKKHIILNSPAQSLMEIKDLVALCEQDLGTQSLSRAWDGLQTYLPYPGSGRTQFSKALEALSYPFKDQSLIFMFCATCLPQAHRSTRVPHPF